MLIYINDNTAEDMLGLLRDLEGKIAEQIEGRAEALDKFDGEENDSRE